MSLIFERQNQTGRIGPTTLIMKPEFTHCFLKKALDFRTAESDGQDRTDDPYNETRIYILFYEESPRQRNQ